MRVCRANADMFFRDACFARNPLLYALGEVLREPQYIEHDDCNLIAVSFQHQRPCGCALAHAGGDALLTDGFVKACKLDALRWRDIGSPVAGFEHNYFFRNTASNPQITSTKITINTIARLRATRFS